MQPLFRRVTWHRDEESQSHEPIWKHECDVYLYSSSAHHGTSQGLSRPLSSNTEQNEGSLQSWVHKHEAVGLCTVRFYREEVQAKIQITAVSYLSVSKFCLFMSETFFLLFVFFLLLLYFVFVSF